MDGALINCFVESAGSRVDVPLLVGLQLDGQFDIIDWESTSQREIDKQSMFGGSKQRCQLNSGAADIGPEAKCVKGC